MSDKGKTGRGVTGGGTQPRAPGNVHDIFGQTWFTPTFIMLLTSVDAIFSIGGFGGAINPMNVWRTDKGEPEEPGSANTRISTEEDFKRVKQLILDTVGKIAQKSATDTNIAYMVRAILGISSPKAKRGFLGTWSSAHAAIMLNQLERVRTIAMEKNKINNFILTLGIKLAKKSMARLRDPPAPAEAADAPSGTAGKVFKMSTALKMVITRDDMSRYDPGRLAGRHRINHGRCTEPVTEEMMLEYDQAVKFVKDEIIEMQESCNINDDKTDEDGKGKPIKTNHKAEVDEVTISRDFGGATRAQRHDASKLSDSQGKSHQPKKVKFVLGKDGVKIEEAAPIVLKPGRGRVRRMRNTDTSTSDASTGSDDYDDGNEADEDEPQRSRNQPGNEAVIDQLRDLLAQLTVQKEKADSGKKEAKPSSPSSTASSSSSPEVTISRSAQIHFKIKAGSPPQDQPGVSVATPRFMIAFNYFAQQQMALCKAHGDGRSEHELLEQITMEWGELSEADKKLYADRSVSDSLLQSGFESMTVGEPEEDLQCHEITSKSGRGKSKRQPTEKQPTRSSPAASPPRNKSKKMPKFRSKQQKEEYARKLSKAIRATAKLPVEDTFKFDAAAARLGFHMTKSLNSGNHRTMADMFSGPSRCLHNVHGRCKGLAEEGTVLCPKCRMYDDGADPNMHACPNCETKAAAEGFNKHGDLVAAPCAGGGVDDACPCASWNGVKGQHCSPDCEQGKPCKTNVHPVPVTFSGTALDDEKAELAVKMSPWADNISHYRNTKADAGLRQMPECSSPFCCNQLALGFEHYSPPVGKYSQFQFCSKECMEECQEKMNKAGEQRGEQQPPDDQDQGSSGRDGPAGGASGSSKGFDKSSGWGSGSSSGSAKSSGWGSAKPSTSSQQGGGWGSVAKKDSVLNALKEAKRQADRRAEIATAKMELTMAEYVATAKELEAFSAQQESEERASRGWSRDQQSRAHQFAHLGISEKQAFEDKEKEEAACCLKSAVFRSAIDKLRGRNATAEKEKQLNEYLKTAPSSFNLTSAFKTDSAPGHGMKLGTGVTTQVRKLVGLHGVPSKKTTEAVQEHSEQICMKDFEQLNMQSSKLHAQQQVKQEALSPTSRADKLLREVLGGSADVAAKRELKVNEMSADELNTLFVNNPEIFSTGAGSADFTALLRKASPEQAAKIWGDLNSIVTPTGGWEKGDVPLLENFGESKSILHQQKNRGKKKSLKVDTKAGEIVWDTKGEKNTKVKMISRSIMLQLSNRFVVWAEKTGYLNAEQLIDYHKYMNIVLEDYCKSYSWAAIKAFDHETREAFHFAKIQKFSAVNPEVLRNSLWTFAPTARKKSEIIAGSSSEDSSDEDDVKPEKKSTSKRKAAPKGNQPSKTAKANGKGGGSKKLFSVSDMSKKFDGTGKKLCTKWQTGACTSKGCVYAHACHKCLSTKQKCGCDRAS